MSPEAVNGEEAVARFTPWPFTVVNLQRSYSPRMVMLETRSASNP